MFIPCISHRQRNYRQSVRSRKLLFQFNYSPLDLKAHQILFSRITRETNLLLANFITVIDDYTTRD